MMRTFAVMANLLHEFWRGPDDGEFGRVSAEFDQGRAKMAPELRFEFEIWAGSWREAMRLYEERAYDEFGKTYDHFPDTIYSDEDEADQRAFLRVRGHVR
jgi:hypothetical protein